MDSMDSEQKINILLVDDHLNNLLVLEAILESLGQNLVKAQSGEEALECLLKQDFGLILLDIQMPGMDGFETASLIRRREKSRYTPIIFLTAIHRDVGDAGRTAEFRPGDLRCSHRALARRSQYADLRAG